VLFPEKLEKMTRTKTIELIESEGVGENDFYWQLQLTLRNNGTVKPYHCPASRSEDAMPADGSAEAGDLKNIGCAGVGGCGVDC
jgi:hypothetical protein